MHILFNRILSPNFWEGLGTQITEGCAVANLKFGLALIVFFVFKLQSFFVFKLQSWNFAASSYDGDDGFQT